MEIINLDQLRIIAGQRKLNIIMIEKDYLVTLLLYLIKDVPGIYFKGGTALNKLYLNHKRLSEDLDFSLTRNIKDVEGDIRKALEGSIFTLVSKGWTKIIFKKDILELCKELQDKQSEFGYELEYPTSEEAKREFLEWLSKNLEHWPFMLRFKRVEGKS